MIPRGESGRYNATFRLAERAIVVHLLHGLGGIPLVYPFKSAECGLFDASDAHFG